MCNFKNIKGIYGGAGVLLRWGSGSGEAVLMETQSLRVREDSESQSHSALSIRV